jgi:hypothetical protein
MLPSGDVVGRGAILVDQQTFTGTVNQVVFDLTPTPQTTDEHELHQHAAVQAVGLGAAG